MRITIARALPAVAELVQPPPQRTRANGAIEVLGAIGRQQGRGPRGSVVAAGARVGREHSPQSPVGERAERRAARPIIIDKRVRCQTTSQIGSARILVMTAP